MADLNSNDDANTQVDSGAGLPWSYSDAFVRHRGLINEEEQARLRDSRIGIIGMGGVGGVDLITLARLGVGKFTIADPDTFEVSNTNRQFGAMSSTLGRRKVDVMAGFVRDINPEAEVTVFPEAIGDHNADAFLHGVDVLVDGIDAFEIGLRRLVFRLARERGIYALGAGPVGFSTVWVTFAPDGMSFDEYFDLNDDMDSTETFAAYIVGMAPKATQRGYIDMSQVDISAGAAPSVGLACQLASGVIGGEVAKILLKRGPLRPAPHYHQFDVYLGKFVRRRLMWGNRHPLQRLKRRLLVAFLRKHVGDST